MFKASNLFYESKVSKAVSPYAMEIAGGRGSIAPTFLDLDTRWGEWPASHPAALYPRGRTPVAISIRDWVRLRVDLDREATG
jgi:hypothetical protein